MSLIIFFLLIGLLGFLPDLCVRQWRADVLEKTIMRLGLGMSVFPLLGVLLNLFHVPLDWKVFLAVGLGCAGGAALKRGLKKSRAPLAFGAPGRNWWIRTAVLAALFGVTAYMYVGGSFKYSWFEDGDPWGYAVSSKYVAEKKTFTAPTRFNHYASPYTQGYQILMGVLHQTNRSIYWTMKFYNALILSFGVLFFYCFVRKFARDDEVAITATFFLFAVPAWLSHFVFSLNFNMVVFVVALYVAAMMISPEGRAERGWRIIGAVVMGSLWVTHFYTAFMGSCLIFLLWANKILIDKEADAGIFQALFFGVLLSMLFYVPAYAPYARSLSGLRDLGGVEGILPFLPRLVTWRGLLLALIAASLSAAIVLFRRRLLSYLGKALQRPEALGIFYLGAFAAIMAVLMIPDDILRVLGTGSREYTLSDFFIAKSENLINNPRGIGLAVMGFFCLGALYCVAGYKALFTGENLWLSTTLIWSAVSVLVILGSYFSVSVAPFRMWTFFAPFACIMAAYGVSRTVGQIPGRGFKLACWAALAAVVVPTSFVPKYRLNTSIWPDHMVRVPESRALYEQIRNGAIPRESRVLRLCGDSMFLVGYDMSLDPVLDKHANGYHGRALQDAAEQNLGFLKQHGISYVTLGLSCAAERKLPEKAFREYVQGLEEKKIELEKNPGFQKILETRSEVLFRVR